MRLCLEIEVPEDSNIETIQLNLTCAARVAAEVIGIDGILKVDQERQILSNALLFRPE